MDKKRLTYLVIGAGGTGGAIGSHMARAGHNVTFIARGRHLAAMRENGLIVSRPDCEFFIAPVNAFTADFLRQFSAGQVIIMEVGNLNYSQMFSHFIRAPAVTRYINIQICTHRICGKTRKSDSSGSDECFFFFFF